jgi:hypothetical protein
MLPDFSVDTVLLGRQHYVCHAAVMTGSVGILAFASQNVKRQPGDFYPWVLAKHSYINMQYAVHHIPLAIR